MRPLLWLPLLLVAACGGDDVVTTADPPAAGTSLVVEVDAGTGATERWRLTCEPVGGDHPDPEGACAAVAAQPDPFAPIPPEAVCTQVYGGPETATVRGTHRGRPVDLGLARTDGCRMSQWDALAAVVAPGQSGSRLLGSRR
jgi:hypothetical protein